MEGFLRLFLLPDFIASMHPSQSIGNFIRQPNTGVPIDVPLPIKMILEISSHAEELDNKVILFSELILMEFCLILLLLFSMITKAFV